MARVLIVEDDADIGDLCALTAQGEGHDVLFCRSGEQAVAAAAAFRPDVVLLDLRMPGMDGREVARRLRSAPETRKAPIVLMSAFLNMTAAAREIGTPWVLPKPFDVDDLVGVLDRAMRAPAA